METKINLATQVKNTLPPSLGGTGLDNGEFVLLLEANTRISSTAADLLDADSFAEMVALLGLAEKTPITLFIPAVMDGAYTLTFHPGCAGTVTGLGEKAKSLTTAGTVKVQIDGVDVTGLTGIAPSTGGSFTVASATNTFAATSEITVVYASTLSILGHSLSLNLSQA